MKSSLLPLAIGAFCLAICPSHGATLIEYNFDQQSTTKSYLDQSGNNRTLTYNRDVTVNNAYPFSSTHPPAGGTPVNPVYPGLAGTDKSATTTYNLATNASVSDISGINLTTTGVFTMEGWVNLQGIASILGTPTGGALWSLASSTGGTSRFSLEFTSTGVVQGTFNAQSQSGGTRTFSTGITLSLNSWTHLAYVKTANNVQIYINGELALTFQEAGITSRALPTALGSMTVAGNIYGSVDDFRFSNAALTSSQLGYFTPFTVPEPSTTAMLAFGGLWMLRRKRNS